MTFPEFFEAIWGAGVTPFPWQEELARRALEGSWPKSIGLPTAAGKTAVLDVAVYALAQRAPGAARRIFFVVDRRVVVDEAAARAERLKDALEKAAPESELGKVAQRLREIGRSTAPLVTATLRGGIPKENWWTDSPIQPAIVCSTVDQIGSSLLFQAYGVSPYARPIRAGLAAYDSLIVLDEAHTSQPFAETLGWIKRYRGWGGQQLEFPLTVVEMSATPRGSEVLEETEKDRQHPILQRRWETEKKARAVLEEDETEGKGDRNKLVKALVREARTLRDRHGAKVIGVIANRVETARRAFEDLKNDDGCAAILLTGRARPYDRDRLWERWKTQIGLEREADPENTVFVVATQCIEVGANIDFDGLVTEIASIDALEQRFGRLARGGREAPVYAAIVALKSQTARNHEDPVYGTALGHVWRWLKDRTVKTRGKKTKKEEFVPMGVAALRAALRDTEERKLLIMPRSCAPVLMPAHLDLLCQTSPEPATLPEPAVFLHGPNTDPADVSVIWRQDLETSRDPEKSWAELVSICPPSAAEAIALPIWAVRKWLANQEAVDLADLEGVAGTVSYGRNEKGASRGPVLAWRGEEESEVLWRPEEVRPGMTIIVPAAYGGCDDWGWNPESTDEVKDIGDAVNWELGHPMLRFHPKLAKQWKYTAFAKRIQEEDSEGEARDALAGDLDADAEHWVSDVVAALRRRAKLVENPTDDGSSWAAAIGRSVFDQESRRASYTLEVPLAQHLEGCANWAARFASELPERLCETVIRAAALHDIGKADPRFQAWLRGGNPIKPDELLAKSGRNGQNPSAIERARKLAGYPKGGRHELMSVALLGPHGAEFAGLDFDLLLHLIASHHGRCRPFAPVVEDEVEVAVAYGGWSATSDHHLELASSGVSERYWRLLERYGWYGLAFLETFVRLADQRQSEQEQVKSTAEAAHA
jgi:CRISPR-associated endonuclease/helicase Cas3